MSEDPHTLRDRLRTMLIEWDIKLAGSLVVLATVALSFTSLRDLARICGFTGWLAWAWPVCLDAVAYLGTRVWLGKGTAWKFARSLAVGTIALSLVANGLVHGLAKYEVAPHWVIIVLVGAVPPLMLALVIHMLVANRSALPAPKPARKTLGSTKIKTEPVKVKTEPAATPVSSADSLTTEMQAAGWAPGDYPSAKAAMLGYLNKVNPSISGAELEKVIGKHFEISANTGVGRRVVREFKASIAAASHN